MRSVAMLAVVCAIGAGTGLAQQGGMMPRGEGGMGGMMGQREMANLKALAPERAVESVKYCKGQYFVRTKAGDVLESRSSTSASRAIRAARARTRASRRCSPPA